MKTRVTPRQAMSARQVDRVEKDVTACLGLLEQALCYEPDSRCCIHCNLKRRLTRLLASVKRSERR